MKQPLFSSFLDRTFPAAWMLGAGLCIAIVLMVYCGWRIFLLDSESHEIARERLLLERDRDEFLTYGSDLPQLMEKHKSLELETRQYEIRKASLAEEVSQLEDQRAALKHETGDLIGSLAEMRGQAEVVKAELAAMKADMAKLAPENDAIKKTLASLQAQEKALNESILQKQKREAALSANLEGMERQRAHTSELLTRMANDRELYANFQNGLSEQLAKFSASLGKADELNGEYSRKLSELDQFRARMAQGIETLSVDVQGISGQLDIARKERVSWAALLADLQANAKVMREQTENMTANGKRFADILDMAQNSDKTFQATLITEAAVLNRALQDDAEARSSLAEAARTFARGGEELNTLVKQLKEDGNQLRSLLSGQQGELAGVAETARNLTIQLEKSAQGVETALQSGASLSHSALALTNQVEEIKSRLKIVDTRGGHVENLLDSQADRIKNLTALARELASQIDESRRLGMRFQDVLTEIQNKVTAVNSDAGQPVNDDSGKEGQDAADNAEKREDIEVGQ